MHAAVLLLTVLFCVSLEATSPKCSLELNPTKNQDTFVTFGDSNCVLKGTDIQTVEAWLYPLSASITDGVVFNSGWYTVNGVEKAIVLSIKESHQLMGYVFSKAGGSSAVETISASAVKFITPDAWNHVLWHPKEGRFYLGNVTSGHNVVNGMGSFTPGSEVLVGQSFSGRISALRLWSSLETPTTVTAHFNTRTTACANGVGSAVIAFWDFTACTGSQVSSFNGNSCGHMRPNQSAFKWVENKVTEFELVDPSKDAGHSWVEMCSTPTKCSTNCNTGSNQWIDTISTVPKKPCLYTWMKSHPKIVIITLACFFFVITLVVSLYFSCRKANSNNPIEKPNLIEETETLTSTSSDSDIILPIVVSSGDMRPVYFPLSQ